MMAKLSDLAGSPSGRNLKGTPYGKNRLVQDFIFQGPATPTKPRQQGFAGPGSRKTVLWICLKISYKKKNPKGLPIGGPILFRLRQKKIFWQNLEKKKTSLTTRASF